MGVFRWSKDKKNAKKVVQKSAQKAAQDMTQKSSGETKRKRERRYTLLVEEVYESSRMDGVIVRGYLHGRVKQGDTMYLYHPEKPTKAVHITEIEIGPRQMAETARNQLVDLCLDLQSVEDVGRYAVLTSVKPVPRELADRLIENQRLFGLMMEYGRLYSNSVYMDALLYELCYAKFVLPFYMEKPPVPQPDGTLAFEKDTFVGFRSIKMAGEEGQTVFPAFTDEIAIAAWKDAYKEGQPRQVGTMQLPHLLENVRKGSAGLVINPFGPVPVFFPKELLDQVEKSDVFISRYVRPAAPRQEENSTEA